MPHSEMLAVIAIEIGIVIEQTNDQLTNRPKQANRVTKLELKWNEPSQNETSFVCCTYSTQSAMKWNGNMENRILKREMNDGLVYCLGL